MRGGSGHWHWRSCALNGSCAGTAGTSQGQKHVLPEPGGAEQEIREILDAARRRALVRHGLQGSIAALVALTPLALIIAPSPRLLLIFAAGAVVAIAASLNAR